MASLQKDILASIRIAFADNNTIISEKNIESALTGKRLPFDRSEAEAFVDLWKDHFVSLMAKPTASKTNGSTVRHANSAGSIFMYNNLVNFIESSIMNFVD